MKSPLSLCLFLSFIILISSTRSLDIIVIGAGAAGIAAANEALRLGYDKVTVLEGRNRLGGRVFSDMSLGYAVDLGAAWIHGISKNPVYKLATQNKIKTVEFEYENEKFYSNFASKKQTQSMAKQIKTTSKKFEKYLESQKEDGADVSLGSVVDKYFKTKKIDSVSKGILKNWVYTDLENDYGTTVYNLSRDNFDSIEGFKGEDVLVPGGYVKIFEAISKDLDIMYNKVVSSISQEPGSNKVKVKTKSNEVFEADYVVITVPLGVLKKKTIQFSPELSDAKKQAIQKLEFGTMDKVVIEFTEKFWDDSNLIRVINMPVSPFSYIVNFGKIADENTLVFLVAGNNTYYDLNAASNNTIRDDVVNFLKTIYPDENIEAKKVLVTRWSLDEFSYGSYTSYGVGSSKADVREFSKPEGRIYFAGEHTNAEHLQTVHGAYTSGIAAIRNINKREKNISFNRIAGDNKIKKNHVQ